MMPMCYIYTMKKCNTCKIEKSIDSYHKRNNRPCGTRNICKECYKVYNHKKRENYVRDYDLMKSYSITSIEYNEILKNQNNKCKICYIDSSNLIGRKKYLCVDHCHKTNKIIGLLCDKCNRGIGLLQDNAKIVQNALIYLLNN